MPNIGEELKKVLETFNKAKREDFLEINKPELDTDFKVLKEIIKEMIRQKRIDIPTVIALIIYFGKKYGIPVSILGVTLGFVIYIIIRFP